MKPCRYSNRHERKSACTTLRQLSDIRRNPPRLVGKMVNSVTPVTQQRCGSNYSAPSSRNGELNAEGNSHAQDRHFRRCCCVVPDWRRHMDWRRNTDFDQCACWFDHRSILDDGECKEPRTTSIEPPVAKQALKKPRAMCLGLYFSVH